MSMSKKPKRTSIQISDEARHRLVRVAAQLQLVKGEPVSYTEALMVLIDHWELSQGLGSKPP